MPDNDARPTPGRAFFKSEHFAFAPASAHAIFWSLFIVGFTLDLWSKAAVFNWLGANESYSVIEGLLTIVTANNPGAAFGIAAGRTAMLISVSVVALIVVICIFVMSGKERRITHIALGLFASGVAGNLYDRAFNDGLVRDFIDVVYWPGKHWPAFNVADSMLCISVGLLILSSLFSHKPAQ